MYLKSGSWPEISVIEFNLLKYAPAYRAHRKLSQSFNEKYRKKGVHGLYTLRFSVPIAALAAQVFAIVTLPTSMLIMNFRNRTGEDPIIRKKYGKPRQTFVLLSQLSRRRNSSETLATYAGQNFEESRAQQRKHNKNKNKNEAGSVLGRDSTKNVACSRFRDSWAR